MLYLLTLGVYAAGCALRLYLATGRSLPPDGTAWVRSVQMPLGDALAQPPSALVYPPMLAVHALLIAALIFPPIALALRMRWPWVVPLLVLLAVWAQLPVLALALAVGCILANLAGQQNWRPMVAAILAMVVPAGYLALSAYSGTAVVTLMPLQRWLPGAVAAGALAGALLALTLVCLLGRVPGLRRAVVGLLTTCVLAGAGWIFSVAIGADELAFGRLARDLSPGDGLLEPVALQTWKRKHAATGLAPEAVANSARAWVDQERRGLLTRCERFLARFPHSPRRPEVLYVLARTRSLQLDEHALADGLVRVRADWPHEQSRPLWARLVQEYPARPQSALAEYRLGTLAVRAGDPRAADELLDAARRRLEQLAQNPPRSRPAIEGLFAAKTHLPAPGHYGATLAELDRLTWLMSRNDTLTDPPAAAALGDMLQLNPYQRGYQQRLARLVEKHAETPLAGNIRLAVAQGTADIYTRAERLLNVTDQWREDPDAAIEASYELGRLILREPVLQLNPRVQSPAHYFTLVAQQAPPNPWQRLARDRLQQLDQHPAGQP